MYEIEWGNEGTTELRIVGDMYERMGVMTEEADAFVALPGGCGTFEELFEVLTAKRLGLHGKPIVLLNTRDYFAPCLQLLERCVEEGFMDERHRAMWGAVDRPDQVLDALRSAPPWGAEARGFAAL